MQAMMGPVKEGHLQHAGSSQHYAGSRVVQFTRAIQLCDVLKVEGILHSTRAGQLLTALAGIPSAQEQELCDACWKLC